ncbi:putative transcription factor interactor and regulator CCHC(Zn) family [Lupinus albus]|uniref:Putative transcription factor interactor and regulator CCHC(Zn) family n=1 Tax=Lupinus albus TaxID=3870 RepID=A0A6A4P0G0_LUPAL|nr:putative transcription factor interactor and regulator CCHC(Zn) family [Lupinus albus]
MLGNTMTIINPLTDPSITYYMHPNDGPGIILVKNQLIGSNYHPWSRDMLMALKTKNKLPFIDGTLPRPKPEYPIFGAWGRCNTLVMAWLNHSIDQSIVHSVLWLENAYEIWKDLNERYYQGDMYRICDLQEDLYTSKHGDQSIDRYFTHLKGLWQELDDFMHIPSCVCLTPCSCTLVPTIKSYRKRNYVLRFLKGLNDQYSSVRSQIMMMDPLPSLNKVFSLLMQQERQLAPSLDEPKIFSSASDNSAGRGRFSGRGSKGPYGQSGTSRSSGFSGGRGRGSNTKVCTFCDKTGHTVDLCYRKHGFPPQYKSNASNNTVNSIQGDNIGNPSGSEDKIIGFTQDQHRAILAMLKEPSNQASSQVNTIFMTETGGNHIEDD